MGISMQYYSVKKIRWEVTCVLCVRAHIWRYKVGRLEDPAKFKSNYCFYRLVC